jgi:hypothetical protein
MEVHHKHHVPKKWSEYITEFMMLFAAVTLGFFAENMREHYVERHREHEYMMSLLTDLRRDTAEISKATAYIERQIKGIDTTLLLLEKPTRTQEEIKKLYLINLGILGNRGSELNTSTSAQLRNAGGMRLIKSNEVSTVLAEYWLRNEFSEKYEAIVGDLKLKARDQSYRIYNQFNYINIVDGTGERGVKEGAVLLTNDPMQLIEFANRLSHIKNSMQNVQRRIYLQQLDNATKLIVAIEKSYGKE